MGGGALAAHDHHRRQAPTGDASAGRAQQQTGEAATPAGISIGIPSGMAMSWAWIVESISADAGGSNGYRLRLWKTELAQLATDTGLAITVCHYPPGTSKWNKSA